MTQGDEKMVNTITKTLTQIMNGSKSEPQQKLQDYSMRFGVELRKVTRMERIRINELHVMYFNGHQFEVHVIRGQQTLLNEVAGVLARNGVVDMNKIGLYL